MTDTTDEDLAQNIKVLAARLNELTKVAAKRGICVHIQIHDITAMDTRKTCVIDLTVSRFL